MRALLLRWQAPLAIALGTKFAFFFVAWASYQTRAPEFLHSVQHFLDLWNQWDSPRYLQIARDGYVGDGEDAKNIVFYPLYPALVALVDLVVENQVRSALVVSTLASIALAIAFHELVRREHSEEAATRAVLFLFCFPTGFFLHVYYTESVYLLCAVGFWLAYRARESTASRSTLFGVGVLAGLARVNGLSLSLAAGVEELWKRRSFRTLLALGGPAVGFALYLCANELVQGSFFAHQQWLQGYWHKSFSMPWVGIRNMLAEYPTPSPALAFTHVTTEPWSWFIAFGLLVAGLRSQPLGYSVYSTVNLMLFVSTTFVMSTPRYVLVLFPQYIVLALWTENRPTATQVLLLVMFGLQITYGTHFMFGQWAF